MLFFIIYKLAQFSQKLAKIVNNVLFYIIFRYRSLDQQQNAIKKIENCVGKIIKFVFYRKLIAKWNSLSNWISICGFALSCMNNVETMRKMKRGNQAKLNAKNLVFFEYFLKNINLSAIPNVTNRILKESSKQKVFFVCNRCSRGVQQMFSKWVQSFLSGKIV
jgi:hypothetical protein